MNYDYTDTPEEYAAFFLSENNVTHPDYEYIIHLDEPRCFIKFRNDLAMFASFEEFYGSIAEVQWLDGKRPDKHTEETLLTKAWNFLAIEERILEDEDYDDE